MSLVRSSEEIKNFQVIRKLGEYESFYDYEVINGNLYLTRAMLVNLKKSEIDLNLLKKACSYWCKRNPLLQAQIFRGDANKYDRNFVKFSDEEKFYKFDNVELITTNDPQKWKEIMDREVIFPFDLNTDPLWRLKVLKLVDNPETEFNYVLILTSQHTFGDGRNLFTLIVQLLNILSALIEEKTCPEMLSIKLSEQTAEEMIKSKNFIFGEDNGENQFDKISRRPLCFGDKINGQHGKMEYFTIPNETLKKLISKMKENNRKAKLTGVITGLVALSQKNLQEKYNCKVDSNRVQFLCLTSVREKLGIDNSYNGVFSSALDQCIDFDLNLDNFWEFSEKQTIGLHEMIKKNLDIKHFDYTHEYFETMLNETYDESNLNAIISNIGIMNNTESDVIKVIEHYIRMPVIYGRIGSTIFNAITTINGRLCWAISFNEKYFTQKIIKELISEINTLICKLIL
ncbi:unnamed protein product [Brachionus calyciflorus]|uniref:Condensation domain-containing protein n=1 Tax=Brachionus calyciflorus TaxID=104777 RepID=A0A814P7M4_9BILA|nr:unnamed protein product [Brachionus calyciflorus]